MRRIITVARVFLLAAMFWFAASASASADLVGYWDFDGDVLDQSGNNLHGVLTGTTLSGDVPTAIGGGSSLDFGPSGNNDHVEITANAMLDSGVFTLSMFINDRGQLAGINRLISRSSDSFEVGLNRAIGPPNGQLSYYPEPGWVLTPYVPATNTWQHVALVSSGGAMNIYVNGAPAASGGFTGSPSGNLRIGSRENAAQGEGFNGLMDDVALWKWRFGTKRLSRIRLKTSPSAESPPSWPMVPIRPRRPFRRRW